MPNLLLEKIVSPTNGVGQLDNHMQKMTLNLLLHISLIQNESTIEIQEPKLIKQLEENKSSLP